MPRSARPGTTRVAVAITAVVAAALGLLGLNTFAGTALAGDRTIRTTLPANLPSDDVAKGLIYTGLQRRPAGPCGPGLLEVTGTSPVMCTHGPDAAPAGLSVKAGVPALAAAAPAAQSLAVCEGDGTSGRRVEVLYIHGSTSRYTQYLETFRTLAEGVDTIFNESAKETGGERHVRYVTETVSGACRPVVRDVQIADAALNANDWAPLLNAVKAAGYTRTDRKYLQFVDANVYCGIGGLAGDTRKSDANRSNSGPEYARADNGCWSAGVAAHELGHTLGAVNNNAPNASGYGHCTDEWDVMCYKDGDNVVVRTVCTNRSHDDRLDCNHDDYYSTNPPAGSYLSQYYNVADNLFLIKGSNPQPDSNLARSAVASASYTSAWESVAAINDGIDPSSSNDTVHPRWGTWPNSGQQWAELTWPAAVSVRRAQVYLFDDNQGIDLPSSWRLQYWTGSAYADVPGASGYPVTANAYITVTFTQVSTARLRVVLQSNGTNSVGLLEVKAYAS
ncbi:hypothetical protein ACFO1B_09305 [Dactylosporangium siamense]|uniref:DUF7402 domain-containing protein n=1 Tax=Dactylosporangium siamense TaxID=685454 RepID=A0A919PSF8_9ACTN|nr:hypothetical protein [Dactylosporangium siamense]GIG48887.1 hypothetical protein Dsi01nite_069280 [Dactylosporangium siamense]